MDFLIVVTTGKGRHYGGIIEAANLEDADETAFFIWKALERDGFNLFGVEAFQSFGFNDHLIPITNQDLIMYLSYYSLIFYGKFDGRPLKSIIKYMERLEEYEKCAELLKVSIVV